MSGPSSTPLPDISVVSSEAVPFPKELTEQEMMSMTLEELEAYSSKVSTSIGWEYSTLASYTSIQDSINGSILESESTIRGYSNEIAETDVIVSVAKKRKRELDDEIGMLDTYIGGRQSTIDGLSLEIQAVDTTITSLTNESSQLTQELAASDAAFISSASYYSTLVYDYIGKAMTYAQQVSSIEAESTFLAAAFVEEEFSRQVYESTSASYTALSNDVQALIGQSNEIQTRLISSRAAEEKANNELASTIIAITSLSSMYETSINTQKYYQAVSTQSAKIEAYTKATGLYNETARMADMYPTQKTYQDAKAIALQQLNRSVGEKDVATQVVTELQSIVNVSQSASYEALLKSYQDTIDLEATNMSTFAGRRMFAESEIVRLSSIYDQAQSDIAIYENNIQAYSTFYESSIEGATMLRRSAEADDVEVKQRQTKINQYTAELQQFSTIYEEETLSAARWAETKRSKVAEYEQAIVDLNAYSTFFDSTSIALDGLTQEESRLRTLIDTNTATLKVQSSIYERELVNQEAFSTVIEMSLVQQELAAMQYRETYARAKKMVIQELYNAKLLTEVQNISTQNGNAKALLPAGSPFVQKAVDMNTPVLAAEIAKVNSINSFIASFNTVYEAYQTQITQLGVLSTAISEKGTALGTVLDTKRALDDTPADTNLQTSFTTATATLSAAQERIQTTQNNVAVAKNSLQQVVQSFQATYTSLFSGSEMIAHTSTISSFLEAGFKSVASARNAAANNTGETAVRPVRKETESVRYAKDNTNTRQQAVLSINASGPN